MVPERYQVSGIPIGGGERVTGQYVHRDFCTDKKDVETDQHFITPDGFELIEVQRDTIEPVRAKPKREQTGVGDYRCPNCNAAFITELGITPFCGRCGMALDWSK